MNEKCFELFNKVLTCILIALLFNCKIFSQIILTSEKISDGQLILQYEYLPTYTVVKRNNDFKIVFENLFDEFKPSELFLPLYDLFIAVPNNQNVSIQSRILSNVVVNAMPVTNPSIKIIENEIYYKELEDLKIQSYEEFILIKGFVQIGKSNCLHLKVKLFSIEGAHQTNIITKFEIVVPLKGQYVEKSVVSNETVQRPITNPISGQLFLQSRNNQELKTRYWFNYEQQYLKFGTSTDGVYRITYADLINYGINPNLIEPNKIKLISHGSEIPIFISGESDGVFNSNDFIEFVGLRNMGGKHRNKNSFNEPYNEYLNRYSDTTIYWLTWGIENGVRADNYKSESIKKSLDTLKFFRDVIHIENNNWFDFSMEDQVIRENPYWVGNKTWIEGGLGVGTTTKNFTVQDLYKDDSVFVYCKIMDYASDVITKAHLLSVSVNSDPIKDTLSLNKYETGICSAKYKSGVLKEGINKLNVISHKTIGSINTCATDWYEIEYPRYLIAQNDSLIFSSSHIANSKIYNIMLTGFTSEPITVWRYGDKIKKFIVYKNNGSMFFEDTISKNAKYIAVGEKRILKPIFYYKKRFQNMLTSNSEEYLIITHKKFLDNSIKYASFINSEYKITTRTVDVDDIYDFFNFGFFSPEPIREYLKNKYYSSNSTKLKYVFLIGAATYDYHHNKTKFLKISPTFNYVPSYGAPVSDNWFVCWDSTGANLPQINIGRLPVNSNAELESYLLKHKAYISKPYSSWNKKYIFFSGGSSTTPGQIDQLRSVNQEIIDKYVKGAPLGGNYFHFYKTINPVSNFGPISNNEYKNVIDSGAIAISYIGHSGTRTWDNSIDEVAQLTNKVNRNPLITDFGCSTAKFAEPDVTSFSQLFVLGDVGQAIGYIANSSLGFISSTVTFPQIFYKQLFTFDGISIGEAHRFAKLDYVTRYGSSGVPGLFALTNTLIGDPIVSLPIPTKPNLSIEIKDLEYFPRDPSDGDKFLKMKILFSNYGKVVPDSFSIAVEDRLDGNIIFTDEFKVKVPSFKDSLEVEIPIYAKSGLHNFSIKMDSREILNEFNENDNQINFQITVAATTLKDNFISNHDMELSESIILLNPSKKPLSSMIVSEYSKDQSFHNASVYENQVGEFFTKINLKALQKNQRYYFRSKMKSDNTYNLPKSFYYGNNKSIYLGDANSFLVGKMINTKYQEKLNLDTILIKYELKSAGHLDGSTAYISKNGENLIPENTLRGHHVCVIDEVTFQLLEYKIFDVHGGGQSVSDAYYRFLDTLSEKNLVMFAVANSGEISNQNLKNKIKQFGSKLIDDLEFTGSWVMLGKKFAHQNKILEKLSKPNLGSVQIDTTFSIPQFHGIYETVKYGPAKNWTSIEISDSVFNNNSIEYSLLGFKNGNVIDTIKLKNRIRNTYDIKPFSKNYTFISVEAELHSNNNLPSPYINFIRIKYDSFPELGTNYQVVSLSKDSLDQGEKTNLNFSVYNVGESTAPNFKVRVDLVKKDNSKEKLFEQVVDSIQTEKKKDFSLSYTTEKLTGSNQFQINIDLENSITELYKDNNFYSVPFYVKPNDKPASLKLTIDGNDILNGDFISSKPNFKIELNDESLIPITDTSKVLLYLNNQRIYFANNSGIMTYNYSSSNPKMVVNYNPTLSDGNYTLKVVGKNATDQLIDSTGIIRKFTVKNELQLLNAYNYPNPFKDDTYFTFKLTQLPDELKIIIYTIAGRKIKEIKLNSSELRFDFNRIPWDGRDEDGDLAANGVYLYKVISKKGSEKTELTQKLSIIR